MYVDGVMTRLEIRCQGFWRRTWIGPWRIKYKTVGENARCAVEGEVACGQRLTIDLKFAKTPGMSGKRIDPELN